MLNKYVIVVSLLCSFFYCNNLYSQKKIVIEKGPFLLENDRLIGFDEYVRDPVFVKSGKNISYKDGVYLFGIDLGTLFNYGYKDSIVFDDSVKLKRADFFKNAILVKKQTFSYLKIDANFTCYFIGDYNIPIPLFSHKKTNRLQKYHNEMVPVYVIVNISK